MDWSGGPITQQPFHGAAVGLHRRQIHLGLIRPDERLPPERKPAQDLGISRITLREVLKVPEEAGYLTVRRGATGGTFVVGEDAVNDIALNHISSDHSRAWRRVECLRAVKAMPFGKLSTWPRATVCRAEDFGKRPAYLIRQQHQ